jgi:hypothetical protein
MEEFMGFMASRLFEVFIIQHLYPGVFMRLPDRKALVLLVYSLCPFLP